MDCKGVKDLTCIITWPSLQLKGSPVNRQNILLKQIPKSRLPTDVVGQRKQGVESRMAAFLRTDLADSSRNLLSLLPRNVLIDVGDHRLPATRPRKVRFSHNISG